MVSARTLAIPLLALGLACGPKHLETRVDARRAETLQAECRKVEGRWEVSLRLPAGHWAVGVDEAQPFELLPGEPRATLRWRVEAERWRQARPVTFTIASDTVRMELRVRYPGPSSASEHLQHLLVVVWQLLGEGMRR